MNCHKDHNCKCTSIYSQTLDDMEFERGIWYAAQYGDIERVKKLAANGVDVLDNAGYTALHYAARSGNVDVCKLLISLGASIDIQTRAGFATPLHRAASTGKTEVVKVLIAAGADVRSKDSDGHTPLHRAAMEGHSEIIKLLVSVDNTFISERDNRGRSPYDLILSTSSAQDTEILRLLR